MTAQEHAIRIFDRNNTAWNILVLFKDQLSIASTDKRHFWRDRVLTLSSCRWNEQSKPWHESLIVESSGGHSVSPPNSRNQAFFSRPIQGFKLATGHHRVRILSLNHLLKNNVSELKSFRDCLKIKVFYPCNYGLMLGLQWRSTIKVRDKIIFGLMDESYWFFFDGCYHTPWIALTRKFLIDRHGL